MDVLRVLQLWLCNGVIAVVAGCWLLVEGEMKRRFSANPFKNQHDRMVLNSYLANARRSIRNEYCLISKMLVQLINPNTNDFSR